MASIASCCLIACGGGTTPLIDYCCVDTLVHVDSGQDLTGLQQRGTISLVWNQRQLEDTVQSTFAIDALFLDYIANQDSVSGGEVVTGNIPDEGDVWVDITVEGNEAERIPSFTTTMYAPPKLILTVEDNDSTTSGGEVSTEGSVVLKWTPASLPDSKIRVVLRSRSGDGVSISPVELLFTLDDTGEYEFSREALDELPAQHAIIDVIAFRSYKKCTCQNVEPYLLRSASYFSTTLVR